MEERKTTLRRAIRIKVTVQAPALIIGQEDESRDLQLIWSKTCSWGWNWYKRFNCNFSIVGGAWMSLKVKNFRGLEIVELHSSCGAYFQEPHLLLTVKIREKHPVLLAEEGKM